MHTIQAFQREFPELNENALRAAYYVLEVLAPSDANKIDFRAIVVQSIDKSGNLLRLNYAPSK